MIERILTENNFTQEKFNTKDVHELIQMFLEHTYTIFHRKLQQSNFYNSYDSLPKIAGSKLYFDRDNFAWMIDIHIFREEGETRFWISIMSTNIHSDKIHWARATSVKEAIYLCRIFSLYLAINTICLDQKSKQNENIRTDFRECEFINNDYITLPVYDRLQCIKGHLYDKIPSVYITSKDNELIIKIPGYDYTLVFKKSYNSNHIEALMSLSMYQQFGIFDIQPKDLNEEIILLRNIIPLFTINIKA